LPSVLAPKALEMLDDLPPYYQRDPHVQAYVHAVAIELQRLEDGMDSMRYGLFAQYANDERGTLALWEMLLGLPVRPEGISEADRKDKVLATLRGRSAGSAARWVETLTGALGATQWTHEEGPAPYQVTLRIPPEAGTYTAAQVVRIARAITPAHLDIVVAYGTGFLIGISAIGQEPL
jgi:hypothetical protein